MKVVYADAAFNLLMCGLDFFVLFALTYRRKEKPEPILRIALVILIALAVPLLASGVTQYFNLRRFFGLARFMGQALFLHLPAVLLISSFLFQARPLFRNISIALALIVFAIYIFAYHVEPRRLKITHFEFTHPKLKGLIRPIVIAQVSDIQTDRVGEFEQRVFRELAAQDPDLVVYCGDYLQTWTPDEYKSEAKKLNDIIRGSGLKPEFGSFAVAGDCDFSDLWRTPLADLNVRALENEVAKVALPGCVVDIIGLSLKASREHRSESMKSVIRNSSPENLHIYLGHAPDFVTSLNFEKSGFLALAGHTHGGQVQLPFIGAIYTLSRLPHRFADAFAPFGSGTISVSRGIGMERTDAPRLRFLCPPEIRLITLRPPD